MPTARLPPKSFWEDDLELNVDHVLRDVNGRGLGPWISKLSGRQLGVLCHEFGLESSSVQQRRNALRSLGDELVPFVLVERFSQFKSKVAVLDFARGVLPRDVVAACTKAHEEPDKIALLFAIFLRRWSDLRLVFHLDRIHKTGFARMRLRNTVPPQRQPFPEFLTNASVKSLLSTFDQDRRDGHSSDLKSVIPYPDRVLVFIRRAERPGYLVQPSGGIVHGYWGEWIILDFQEDAERVDISSISVDVPLEIANRIASAYFDEECEYDNDVVWTHRDRIQAFLAHARQTTEGAVVLVEPAFSHSPLAGSPELRIRQPYARFIGDALVHLETAIGALEVETVASIKVLFRKKRVSVILEPSDRDDGLYVVRYSDHRLNALERVAFETHMRDTHGITVLSTEKRFKRPA